MTKILVLGAHGQIARVAMRLFANLGAPVSRMGLAGLIVRLVAAPAFGVRQSIGVHAA